MKRTKKFKFILIQGRNWWRRSIGGYFHSVTVTVSTNKGNEVFNSGIHNGGGSMYLQTAFALLQTNGYCLDMTSHADFWHSKNKDKIIYNVVDVPRERDL